MIRQTLFVLQDKPDSETLRRYSTRYGFRLFHEKHSDLYFLQNPAERGSKTPEFGGFYESVLVRSETPDTTNIKAEIRRLVKSKKLSKYQFNLELLQDALFFSGAFKTKIFAAFHDDEDVDMAIAAKNGTLIRLGLSGMQTKAGQYELRKIGERDFDVSVTSEPDGYDGLYSETYKTAFGTPAPDLLFFGQVKPKGEELKTQAKQQEISQAALLRRYGQFKLIDSEDASISAFRQKLVQKLGFGLKILLLPFLLIGFFIWEAIQNKKK